MRCRPLASSVAVHNKTVRNLVTIVKVTTFSRLEDLGFSPSFSGSRALSSRPWPGPGSLQGFWRPCPCPI
eukprot:2887909-Rhodomonas_salina.1